MRSSEQRARRDQALTSARRQIDTARTHVAGGVPQHIGPVLAALIEGLEGVVQVMEDEANMEADEFRRWKFAQGARVDQ